MKTVITYKGVVLKQNVTINGYLGSCPYAVYLSNGNHFEFFSIAEFKRVVNAADESLGIMEIQPDGKWNGAGVRQKDFRTYALNHQITDGLKFKEPHEGEFFSIVEYGTGKEVELLGFNWEDEGKWHFVETRLQAIPIEEFIEGYRKEGFEYVQRLEETARQTQYDLTKKEALVDYTRKAFGGQPPVAHLPFSQITVNSPIGNYIE